MPSDWIQIRGDPSIRRFLFLQERELNEFDRRLDKVLASVENLICNYGVFHAKVHFSSGQVTLWLVDDPLRYRVHVQHEFLNLNAYHAYPLKEYSQDAVIKQDCISPNSGWFQAIAIKRPANIFTVRIIECIQRFRGA